MSTKELQLDQFTHGGDPNGSYSSPAQPTAGSSPNANANANANALAPTVSWGTGWTDSAEVEDAARNHIDPCGGGLSPESGRGGPPVLPPTVIASGGDCGDGGSWSPYSVVTASVGNVTLVVDKEKYPDPEDEPQADVQPPFAMIPFAVRGALAVVVAGVSIALAITINAFFLVLLVVALMIVATEEGSSL